MAKLQTTSENNLIYSPDSALRDRSHHSAWPVIPQGDSAGASSYGPLGGADQPWLQAMWPPGPDCDAWVAVGQCGHQCWDSSSGPGCWTIGGTMAEGPANNQSGCLHLQDSVYPERRCQRCGQRGSAWESTATETVPITPGPALAPVYPPVSPPFTASDPDLFYM